jgi:hypothetical protein
LRVVADAIAFVQRLTEQKQWRRFTVAALFELGQTHWILADAILITVNHFDIIWRAIALFDVNIKLAAEISFLGFDHYPKS